MTKEEQQKFFGINNDVVFKLVFCQQYFAKKFIEKTLNQKIGNITYIDSEKEFLETIGNIDNKGVRFDIYVEDDLGNRFDIEMQNYQKKDDNLTFRMRYYMHMMDVNHLNKVKTTLIFLIFTLLQSAILKCIEKVEEFTFLIVLSVMKKT